MVEIAIKEMTTIQTIILNKTAVVTEEEEEMIGTMKIDPHLIARIIRLVNAADMVTT